MKNVGVGLIVGLGLGISGVSCSDDEERPAIQAPLPDAGYIEPDNTVLDAAARDGSTTDDPDSSMSEPYASDASDAGEWLIDDALMGAMGVEVAALVDAIEHPDASGFVSDGGVQFHDVNLASEFVAATPAVAQEIVALLAARGSYMDNANACFNEHVALRVGTPDGAVDFIVGIDCWNVSAFLPEGVQYNYLNPGDLERLAQLAHDTVPQIDVSDLGQ